MLDAVILAGGKSERLHGIVPPYFKPFLVIDGQSLLVAAVKHAQRNRAERIVVVATGENALPVWQLVGHMDNVRVILSAGGPGTAVHTGLELCNNERVLVLMSDNIHDADDVITMCSYPGYSIGVQNVTPLESLRFTRWDYNESNWVEGRVPTPDESWDSVVVWCGPLVINRRHGLDALRGQEKIGPHLSQLFPVRLSRLPNDGLTAGRDVMHFKVTSRDVGVPDVVAELTAQER